MSDFRVCIVAEHASMQLGGEAILPCQYFRIMRSRGIDAWLVVHERTRKELETLFAGNVDRIHFVPDRLLQKIFYKVGSVLPRRVAEATFGLANQLITQFSAREITRSLVTPRCVVHQPIPVSPRFPSLMWGLGAPVVIGPLNGSMDYPPAFRATESAWSRALIALGRSFTNMMNALLPGKRHAAVVLVANQRTSEALPSKLMGRVIELPENGVELGQWEPAAPGEQTPPMSAASSNFVFIGRLVDWKALDILIAAIAHTPAATLDVIGDGPMLSEWRALARELRAEERVRFRGWVSQADCAQYLARACALVLPSLYECGGAVVLEAMAAARPVIATAWGGPAEYLDATCGILIPPTGRAAMVEGFAVAMKALIDSPQLARELGIAGHARVVEHFDWEKKVYAMLKIYESALPEETASA